LISTSAVFSSYAPSFNPITLFPLNRSPRGMIV
jgi:hypothetical protein